MSNSAKNLLCMNQKPCRNEILYVLVNMYLNLIQIYFGITQMVQCLSVWQRVMETNPIPVHLWVGHCLLLPPTFPSPACKNLSEFVPPPPPPPPLPRNKNNLQH